MHGMEKIPLYYGDKNLFGVALVYQELVGVGPRGRSLFLARKWLLSFSLAIILCGSWMSKNFATVTELSLKCVGHDTSNSGLQK